MNLTFSTITATAAVSSIPTKLHGVLLSDSSAGASLTITDGNGGAEVLILRTVTAQVNIPVMFPHPVLLQNGIYATIAGGTAPKASFFYS